jgi:hypothetical protein
MVSLESGHDRSWHTELGIAIPRDPESRDPGYPGPFLNPEIPGLL